jgi:hypothetical protein
VSNPLFQSCKTDPDYSNHTQMCHPDRTPDFLPRST